MLTVTGPARSRALLSLEEIKAAVGETGTDNDAALTKLGLQVSDAVSSACGIVGDGVEIPTLKSEDLLDTFRISTRTMSVTLSRRFVTDIAEVLVGETALGAANYELERSTGVLRYLDDQWREIPFPFGRVAVSYTAGLITIPEGLKLATSTLLVEAWSSTFRDPLLRSESHEGLGSSSFYKSSIASPEGWPKAVSDMLVPYRRLAL